jgi:hypothetical protein
MDYCQPVFVFFQQFPILKIGSTTRYYPDTIKRADLGAFPPAAGTGLSAPIPQLYLR